MQSSEQALRNKLANARMAVSLRSEQLEALSPLGVLARGYAIVSNGETIVRDAAEVATSDQLDIRLHRGRLRAAGTEVEPDDN